MIGRAVHLAVLTVVTWSCTAGTEPTLLEVAGQYLLVEVDGVSLPAALEAGACPPTIFYGEIGLVPTVAGRRPLYNVFVSAAPDCQPPVPPDRGTDIIVVDFGEWTVRGNSIEFRSERGYGTRHIEIESSGDDARPRLTVNFGDRVYTFERVREFGKP